MSPFFTTPGITYVCLCVCINISLIEVYKHWKDMYKIIKDDYL